MTREEYRELLNSDYWRGFSYSLIKERNFTCEDCGKQFPGRRDKLQVHHLVYRDKNPWSYKPEELLVLCRECHEKRHGIWIEDEEQYNEDFDKWKSRCKRALKRFYKRRKKSLIWMALILLAILASLYTPKSDKATEKGSPQKEVVDKPKKKKKKRTKANNAEKSVVDSFHVVEEPVVVDEPSNEVSQEEKNN
ncbi:MAG: HNH endonuclease [Prevotella sp.]|nr:HNH endonuclease [Prevotella sp.]